MLNQYWNLIFPMLQFVAIQAVYSIYWMALAATVVDIRHKIMAFVAVGGMSAIFHHYIIGSLYTVLVHGAIGISLMFIHCLNWMFGQRPETIAPSSPRNTRVENALFNVIGAIDATEQEKRLMMEIENLKSTGQISEPELEKIYEDNQDFIDSNALVKSRIHQEVINWRRTNNVKCRVITVDGNRRFLNVNHRTVDWLK